VRVVVNLVLMMLMFFIKVSDGLMVRKVLLGGVFGGDSCGE